jgi:Cu/Ag efflux pump CusA
LSQAQALYGLNSSDVAQAIQTAFFGAKVSEVFEQQRSFDLILRFDRAITSDRNAVRAVPGTRLG